MIRYIIKRLRTFYSGKGLLLGIMALALTSCRRDNRDMYITPYDFTGQARVIYGHNDGEPVKFAGKRRIFDIPSSGVLFTTAEDRHGTTNGSDFYCRLPNGTLEPLIEILPHGDPGFQTQLIMLSNGPLVMNVERRSVRFKDSDSLITMSYTVK
jgi:hypothetical protein